jgi:hypothetical protein
MLEVANYSRSDHPALVDDERAKKMIYAELH